MLNREQGQASYYLELIDSEEKVGQWRDLLNRSFPHTETSSFSKDFPIWFSRSQSDVIRIGVFIEGTLVSCTGVRVAELWCDGKLLPVGLIGAVATDPAHQGHGLASSLVKTAESLARDRGAQMLILWSDQFSMYEKLGFKLAGIQTRLKPHFLRSQAVDLPVQSGFIPAIFNQRKEMKTGLKLSDQDLSWYGNHPSVKWYWTGNPSAPRAWIAVGRGIDLPHMIHEWGGETEELAALMRWYESVDSQAEILGHPMELARFDVDFSKIPLFSEPLAMIKNLSGINVNLDHLWVWGLDAV